MSVTNINKHSHVEREDAVAYAYGGFSYESATDADITVTGNAGIKIVGADTTNSALTVNIPEEYAKQDGVLFIIRDEGGNATNNNVTVSPTNVNIDGSATAAISTNDGSIFAYSNGSNLFTI